MTWAATFGRSEPKEGCDARLLAVIGFPHAEDVAIRATRRVTHHDHAVREHPEADHPDLAIRLAEVLNLEVRAGKDLKRILEVEPTIGKCFVALPGIVGDAHQVIVATSTLGCKLIRLPGWQR